MEKYPEFIDPFDKTSANIFVRAEHLARYLYACEYVRKHKLKAVLDAACGNGYGCRALSGHAASVIGVDRNVALIRQGTELNSRLSIQNVNYLSADLGHGLGSLADGCLDCVACFETLEHVSNDEELLKEFRRLLRRGGWLLLSAPKAGYEPLGAGGLPANPHHFRLYSPEMLAEMLQSLGFAVEKALGQPYTNISRVRMQDYCRDKRLPTEQADGYFSETQEALEFYARVWGWPVSETPEKSNVIFLVCKKAR